METESDIVRLVHPVNENDHSLGPANAPATLVEYGDYECPHCRELYPVIHELLDRTEGLRFVYRHFPIVSAHPNAMRVAEAVEAAAAQGKFWEMHDLIYTEKRQLDDHHLERLAKHAGLDMDQYEKDMSSGVYGEKVKDSLQKALFGGGVTGTPTLFLNDVQLSNIHSLDVLLEEVSVAGATPKDKPHDRAAWRERLLHFHVGKTKAPPTS